MKKTFALVLSFVLGTALLTACGSSASSSQASSSQQNTSQPASESTTVPPTLEDAVYRGEVLSVNEETGDFEVAQLPGFNYGSETVVFHVTEETEFEPDEVVLAEGMFVEVTFNGVMTRSMPPQATADEVKVISNMSEGIIVNGEVQSVEKVDDMLRITIVPLELVEQNASESSMENLVILTVEQDDLEGITVDDLVAGTKVSAVTSGIAAMSIPPQMPVIALMPYNWEA